MTGIDSPHPPATFCVPLLCSKNTPSDCIFYDFKNTDYSVSKNKLNSVDWVERCSLKEKDFIEFKGLRVICIFLTRKFRREYIRDIQDSLHNDAKKFCHFTNNLKQS